MMHLLKFAGGGNFADGGAAEQLVGAGSAEGGGAGLPLWVSPLELPASLKVKARIVRLSERKSCCRKSASLAPA